MDIKIGDTVLVGNVCYNDFHEIGTRDWVHGIDTVVSAAKELAGKSFVVNYIDKSIYFRDCYFVCLSQTYAHIPKKALIKINTDKEISFDDDSQSELQSFIDSFVHK